MTKVPLLDVAGVLGWLRREPLAEVIASLATQLEADFRTWERFEKLARVAAHSQSGVIELMPISNGTEYAFKYVNGHPSNPLKQLQTVTAFGVLADVGTGYPVFAAEMTVLTALRTAATSAVAARYLARPDSKVMAFIGAGSQAEFQAVALRTELGVNSIRVWDVDPAAIKKFVQNARGLGFEVTVAPSAAAATHGADLITTCTADKQKAIVLTDENVTPGVHLNAIGGDCPGKPDLDPATPTRASLSVEFEPQTRVEGEIQSKPESFEVTELWRVITSAAPGRSSDDQITLFDSVGFAIEDYSALVYARNQVAGTELVTWLDLVASPADPKDLFSFVIGAELLPVDDQTFRRY